MIVGFPGETEEDFEISKKFCEDIGFAQMHIFPYSVREGTLAAKFENQVPDIDKTRRTHIMLESAAAMKKAYCQSFTDKQEDVLFEQLKDGIWSGRCKNHIEVRAKCDLDLAGKIKTVLLKEYQPENDCITGEIL